MSTAGYVFSFIAITAWGVWSIIMSRRVSMMRDAVWHTCQAITRLAEAVNLLEERVDFLEKLEPVRQASDVERFKRATETKP